MKKSKILLPEFETKEEDSRIQYSQQNGGLIFKGLKFHRIVEIENYENLKNCSIDYLKKEKDGNQIRNIKFKKWYRDEKVLILNGKYYTRQELICYISNKSGDVHVDGNFFKHELFELENEKIKNLINLKPKRSGLYPTIAIISKELIDSLINANLLIKEESIKIKKLDTKNI